MVFCHSYPILITAITAINTNKLVMVYIIYENIILPSSYCNKVAVVYDQMHQDTEFTDWITPSRHELTQQNNYSTTTLGWYFLIKSNLSASRVSRIAVIYFSQFVDTILYFYNTYLYTDLQGARALCFLCIKSNFSFCNCHGTKGTIEDAIFSSQASSYTVH